MNVDLQRTEEYRSVFDITLHLCKYWFDFCEDVFKSDVLCKHMGGD